MMNRKKDFSSHNLTRCDALHHQHSRFVNMRMQRATQKNRADEASSMWHVASRTQPRPIIKVRRENSRKEGKKFF